MPNASLAEIYFIAAMFLLIIVISGAATYFFFRTWKKEKKEKKERHKQIEDKKSKIEIQFQLGLCQKNYFRSSYE